MSDNIHARITGDASDLKRALQDGGQAVEGFGRKATTGLKSVTADAERSTNALRNMAGSLATLGAGGAVLYGLQVIAGQVRDFGAAVLGAQIQADKLRNTLTFATGGRDNAAREMVMLRETSHAMGLEFASTSQQYARLAAASRGTSLEGRQTREVFEAIAQAGTVMGMSAEESEGALRAVQQMMSKGKVQAEELRGQLGERLPGAFQIAARAMGVTTGELDKMLETGQVFAADFLPKFAAQVKAELGGSVLEASKSAQAGLNRFGNAWNDLKISFAQSGASAAVSGTLDSMAGGFGRVSDAINESRASGDGFMMQMLSAGGAAAKFGVSMTELGRMAGVYSYDLETARQHLQKLQSQSEVLGDSVYWKSEKAQVEAYIARLEAARRKKLELSGDFGVGGGRGAVNPQTIEQRNAVDEALQRRLAAARNNALGVKPQFVKDLTELAELEQAGVLGFAERADLASKLTADAYKPGAKKADPYTELIKAAREKLAVQKLEQDATVKLTDAEKLRAKYLADLASGAIKYNATHDRMVMGLYSELQASEQAQTAREAAQKLHEQNAAIIEKNTEAAAKYAEARLKALEGEIQTNDKLREEIALIGLDERGRAARLQLLEQEAIARAEIDLVMARNIEGNDAEISRLEREIALRRERISLMGYRAEREADQRLLEERKRDAEQIGDALTQSLMRGGKSFLDYLKDTARTTVLTPILKPVGQAAGNLVSGGIQALGQGMGFGGGGAGSALSLTSGANNLFQLSGFGSGSSVFSQFATSSFGNALGLSTTVDAIGGIGTASTALTGAGSAFAAAMPWVSAALIAGSLLESPRGGPKTEGGADLAARISAQYSGTAQALGLAPTARFGAFSSQDPQGDALTQLQVAAFRGDRTVYSRQDRVGNYEDIARGDGALQAAEAEETVRAVFLAIKDQSSELAADIRALFDAVGVDASVEQMQAALNRATIVRTQRAELEERLYQATATEEQKLARTREQQLATVDPLNLALLQQVHLQEDLARATQATSNALGGFLANLEASADAERTRIEQQHEDNVTRVRSQMDVLATSISKLTSLTSVLDGALSGYRTAERTGMTRVQALAQVQGATAIARASGRMPDAESLRDPLAVLGRASTAGFGSFNDFAASRDREAATISELNALAGEQLSVEQRTLDVQQQQLDTQERARREALTRLDGILTEARAQTTGTSQVVQTLAAALAAFNGAAIANGRPGGVGGGATAPAYTMEQIAGHVLPRLGVSEASNRALYEDAAANKARGVTLDKIDAAGGLPPGTSAAWAIANGLPVFANGGAFTNGIVSRPTMFNMAMMGEGGQSEGILPLANVGGQLGVRSVGGGDAEMRRSLADMSGKLSAIAHLALRTAKAVEELEDRGVQLRNAESGEVINVNVVATV
ncbi:MAG: tape measure protein [Ramlibacter sp.]